MSSAVSIVHDAVVVRSMPQRSEIEVVVSDPRSEGCSSCVAAVLCKHNGGRFTLRTKRGEQYAPGTRIRIAAGRGLHHRAVGLMLGLPCLMLVLPIVVLCLAGVPEWVALASGVGGCAVTYGIMWLCRRRLDSSANFSIITE